MRWLSRLGLHHVLASDTARIARQSAAICLLTTPIWDRRSLVETGRVLQRLWLLAALHGLTVGALVFAPVSRSTGQHVLIATIGLALALQEYLRLFQGSALRWVEPVLNQPVGIARSQAFVVTITPIAAEK